MRRLIASIAATLSIFASVDLRAGTCTLGQSPFTDVPSTAIFCAEALWLRNAMVTVGCGNGTTYCPNDSVTRAQMALFMSRLAVATSQDTIVSSPVGFTGDLDTGGLIACVTPPYAVSPTGTRRLFSTALAVATLQTNGVIGAFATLEMNTDGGAFQAVGNVSVELPANQRTQISVLGGSGVAAGLGTRLMQGSTYRWRLRLARIPASSTTGDVIDAQCAIKVEVPVDPVP